MKKCQLKNGRRVLLLLGIGILTFAVSFQSKAQVADPGPLVTVTLSGTEYLEDVMLAQVGDYDKIHEVTNLKVVGAFCPRRTYGFSPNTWHTMPTTRAKASS